MLHIKSAWQKIQKCYMQIFYYFTLSEHPKKVHEIYSEFWHAFKKTP